MNASSRSILPEIVHNEATRVAGTCHRGEASPVRTVQVFPAVDKANECLSPLDRREKAAPSLPFDRGGNAIAEGLASGTLLCQIGLHSKMLSFGIPMPGFPRTLKVLIDCGASENYARKESMMMNKEKLEEAVAKSDGRATVRVKMADGSVAEQPRVLITLPTRVGQFVSDETYFVIDLDERWDLILGMGWLEKHQPTINWKLKTISKSLDANKDLGLVSNEPTPNETKSPRRVTLAVEGLATHGHDIALMKAADGQRIASADEDCDGTGDTMTSEDHVDMWGVECDLEKALRDGCAGSRDDPTKKKDATMSWEEK
ncbi:hypothetical protein AeMF1_014648 [Aphanomyces euteiches]|nr:hypothetical protein AeMF1_014648 [Aphanomyces euteiches]